MTTAVILFAELEMSLITLDDRTALNTFVNTVKEWSSEAKEICEVARTDRESVVLAQLVRSGKADRNGQIALAEAHQSAADLGTGLHDAPDNLESHQQHGQRRQNQSHHNSEQGVQLHQPDGQGQL